MNTEETSKNAENKPDGYTLLGVAYGKADCTLPIMSIGGRY